MLELIFQGFWEWLYSLVLECWEYFSSSLLDIMSMDFSYLETRMPVITTIEQSMLAIGWALLIGNLVFQAVRSMLTGLGFEGEDPKLLFTRTFVFAFLLLASPQICELCLNMTSIMIGILEVPDAVNITLADNASFAGLACAWLLVIICGVIVMFQSFKLIVEMAERYFILAVLTISAPLAFGMGGSRNTSDIFTGWCRMYGSMCLLMVLNVAFIKMLLSVLSFYPSGLDVLPWMILVLTVVKVAKKADAIVTRIGLNPAITGDSLGRTFPGALTYLVVRSAASQVTKAIGRNMGGQSKGASGNPPQGGAGNPKTAAPIGGIGHAGKATAQKAGATQSTQQTTAQTAETASSSDRTQVNQGGTAIGVNQQTKKTAVPPGTRRSPMHSSTARAVAANAAVAGMAAQTVAANGLHTGTAGMRTESGGIRNAEMPRPGAAGMGANTQMHRQSQTVQNGTAGMRSGGSVSGGLKTERPGSAGMRDGKSADRAAAALQHGTAGMVSNAQTLRQTQTVQSDTAGMRSDTQTLQQSQTVRSGTAGTDASIGGTRFTRADAQMVRQGAAVSKMQTGVQNNLSVKALNAPGGTANGTTTPSAPKENRFTQRPTAAQAPIPQKPTAPQHGTAGIIPAAAPVSEARHSRNPMPAMTNQGQSAPSPARQESRQVTQAPKASATAPSLHHGTAGIASAKPKETQTRQTAKKPTASAPAVPRKTEQKATSKQTERKSSVKRRSGNGK